MEMVKYFEGILDFYYWKCIPCCRAWPRPPHPPYSQIQADAMDAFKQSRILLKQLSPSMREIWSSTFRGSGSAWLDQYTGAFMNYWGETHTIPPVVTQMSIEKTATDYIASWTTTPGSGTKAFLCTGEPKSLPRTKYFKGKPDRCAWYKNPTPAKTYDVTHPTSDPVEIAFIDFVEKKLRAADGISWDFDEAYQTALTNLQATDYQYFGDYIGGSAAFCHKAAPIPYRVHFEQFRTKLVLDFSNWTTAHPGTTPNNLIISTNGTKIGPTWPTIGSPPNTIGADPPDGYGEISFPITPSIVEGWATLTIEQQPQYIWPLSPPTPPAEFRNCYGYISMSESDIFACSLTDPSKSTATIPIDAMPDEHLFIFIGDDSGIPYVVPPIKLR